MNLSLPELVDREFVNKAPFVKMRDIVNINMGFKSRTGEQFIRVITNVGQIYIKTIAPNGFVETKCIEIPPFNNKDERDEMILYLKSRGCIQDDIADYLGISQATVSNILRKNR